MRSVFGSALVLLAFTALPADQDHAITPQHMELPSRYPLVARAARLQGTITVKLTISGDGRVVTADAISQDALLKSHPLMQTEVAGLMRRWKFACSNCAKQSTHPYDVTFTYKLEGKESANADTQIAVDWPNQVTVTAHPPIAMAD
jgi:TonB family protein